MAMMRAVHKGCGGAVTELWNDLNEYQTVVPVGAAGEEGPVCGELVGTVDGGSREGWFCTTCDRYIDRNEVEAGDVVALSAKVPVFNTHTGRVEQVEYNLLLGVEELGLLDWCGDTSQGIASGNPDWDQAPILVPFDKVIEYRTARLVYMMGFPAEQIAIEIMEDDCLTDEEREAGVVHFTTLDVEWAEELFVEDDDDDRDFQLWTKEGEAS